MNKIKEKIQITIANKAVKKLGFNNWDDFKREVKVYKELDKIQTLYSSFKEEADVIAKLLRINSFYYMIYYILLDINNVVEDVNKNKNNKIEAFMNNIFDFYEKQIKH